MVILLIALFLGMAFQVALQSQHSRMSLARSRRIRVERPRRECELARVRRSRVELAA